MIFGFADQWFYVSGFVYQFRCIDRFDRLDGPGVGRIEIERTVEMTLMMMLCWMNPLECVLVAVLLDTQKIG